MEQRKAINLKRLDRRRRLLAVLRESEPFITVTSAAFALGLSQARAAKTLSDWSNQGWLKRIRRGLYVPIPLDVRPEQFALEDPWQLVPILFNPGYVGGWTAAEHWDLTEQLFRSVCVLTTLPSRRRERLILGVPFHVKHISRSALFGTRNVWRNRTRVAVSDPARTVIDMLADPSIGGGIVHVNQCLQQYLSSRDSHPELLVEYGERLGNAAVFKRLGFLASRISGFDNLAQACARRLSAGNAKLDPKLPCPRLVKSWRLWIPETWKTRSSHD